MQLVYHGEKLNSTVAIPCWNIKDVPLYEWRGLMLDESRHFFGMDKVKSLLDWMAYYKLNRFHWHLTDEPAWRLEVKQYPLLTLVGGIGTYTNPGAPSQFYTQKQVAEIIRYAAERNIVVLPEIDMPGHATAANRAYPQFSGGGMKNIRNLPFTPASRPRIVI
ncbi:family 20 glycosylhydrolase [Niabella hibiscisoli]|uniref:family 20 glycosylhydrolase n=1 Tax=Niabella hibiscisoli TaxID=1825928 RepID=UPI0021D46EA7|nr:family 20 glycosylhydrolase [Niabella hibiscisoli]